MKSELLLRSEERNYFRLFGLLCSDIHWHSMKELGKLMNISRPTLIKTIDGLKKRIIDFGMEERVSIEGPVYRNGIRICYKKEEDLIKFKKDFVLKTSGYQIVSAMFQNEEINIMQKSKDLGVCQSVAREILKGVESDLGYHHIQITSRNFKLIGEEIQIREYLFWFWSELCSFESWPFENQSMEDLRKVVEFLYQLLGLENISEETTFRVMLRFAITTHRLERYDQVISRPQWDEFFEEHEHFDKVAEVLDQLYWKNELTIHEKRYLYLVLQFESEIFSHLQPIGQKGIVMDSTNKVMNFILEQYPELNLENKLSVICILQQFHTKLLCLGKSALSMEDMNKNQTRYVKEFNEFSNFSRLMIEDWELNHLRSVVLANTYIRLLKDYLFEKKEIQVYLNSELSENDYAKVREKIYDNFGGFFPLRFVSKPSEKEKADIMISTAFAPHDVTDHCEKQIYVSEDFAYYDFKKIEEALTDIHMQKAKDF
ncbi:MAG: helix-turn-helix domain-containing protein [Lactobacillales bacterium]|nr:helix-turn-helix domain-containing protein [Lactobacillales bacterium]